MSNGTQPRLIEIDYRPEPGVRYRLQIADEERWPDACNKVREHIFGGELPADDPAFDAIMAARKNDRASQPQKEEPQDVDQ